MPAIEVVDKIVQAKQAAFLGAFKEAGTISAAASVMGIKRSVHYAWLESSPEYAEQFNEAISAFADSLEAECFRRARDGVVSKKFYKGEPIIDPATGQQYEERNYSDQLLIRALEGYRPERYADNSPRTLVDARQIKLVVVDASAERVECDTSQQVIGGSSQGKDSPENGNGRHKSLP